MKKYVLINVKTQLHRNRCIQKGLLLYFVQKVQERLKCAHILSNSGDNLFIQYYSNLTYCRDICIHNMVSPSIKLALYHE